jgi:hypothetical protein
LKGNFSLKEMLRERLRLKTGSKWPQMGLVPDSPGANQVLHCLHKILIMKLVEWLY